MDARPLDADNHYYETLDSCTRHLDKKFADRGVKAVQDGKRVKVLMGGKVNGFIPNPTFDPIIVPGCLDPLFRGPDPRGRRPPHAHAGGAAVRAPRVPGPRRAPAGDGRAGPRRRAPLPDLRVRRGAGPEGRHPGDDGHPVGLQPLARGGLGLRPRGPAVRRRHALASPTSTPPSRRSSRCSSAASGSSTSGPRPCPPATAPAARSATRSTTRCGPGSPRPACRWPSTSATAATRPASRRRGAAGPTSASARAIRSAACSPRAGRSTTPSPRSSSTASSSATRRCGWRASRTAPTGWACS